MKSIFKTLQIETMPNYFYIDNFGRKQGPVNDRQLQALAAQGAVTPQTQLETESGHKGMAGQIPGMNFQAPASPMSFPSPATTQTQTVSAPINASKEALNRQTYIILAMFGGWAGWHCIYAGYRKKQMIHFWLAVFGLLLLAVFGIGLLLLMVSQAIAVNEMFCEYDANGRMMKE